MYDIYIHAVNNFKKMIKIEIKK